MSKDIHLYPNPASEEVNITFSGKHDGETYLMEILDMNGKTILNKKINVSGSYATKVYIDELPGGLYILKLSNDHFIKSFHLFIF
jgi:hypothetical protein